MGKNLLLFICLLPAAFLSGCMQDDNPTRDITYRFVKTETYYVASEKGIGIGMLGAWPSTMLRTWSDDWFAANVEGFDYESGYEYCVTANKYKVIVPDNMCYDGPSYKYVLKKIISKNKRDTEGISWLMPCYDNWPGKPETWKDVQDGVVHVIRTEDELLAMASAETPPAGELFGRNSILLVSGQSPNGIVRIEKRLTYLGGGKYDLTIDVYCNDKTVVQPWEVAILVPAIPEGADITLKVNHKQ